MIGAERLVPFSWVYSQRRCTWSIRAGSRDGPRQQPFSDQRPALEQGIPVGHSPVELSISDKWSVLNLAYNKPIAVQQELQIRGLRARDVSTASMTGRLSSEFEFESGPSGACSHLPHTRSWIRGRSELNVGWCGKLVVLSYSFLRKRMITKSLPQNGIQ